MTTTKKAIWLQNHWSSILFVLSMIFTSCCFFDQKFTIYYWLFSMYRPQKLILSFVLPFTTGLIHYIKRKDLIDIADKTAFVMSFSAFLYSLDVFVFHWSWARTDFLSTFTIIYKLETFFAVLLLIVIITIYNQKNGKYQNHFNTAYHTFFCGYTPLFIVCFCVIFFRARSYFSDNTIVNFLPLHGELNYLLNNQTAGNPLRDVGNIVFFITLSLLLIEMTKKNKIFYGIALPIFISVSIECFQLVFKNGDTDIDDIITNTIGVIIGFLINQIIIEKVRERENDRINRSNGC